MNKRIGTKKLSRTKSHREALIKNQLRSVFEHGYIVTTTAKAKVVKQRLSEFLHEIKQDDLEATRNMHVVLGNPILVKKAKDYMKKGEGKVTMVKVSFRDGDSGETSKLSLMGYEEVFGKKKSKKVQENRTQTEKKDGGKTDEKHEVMEEKDNIDKGLMGKINTNLKGKFVSKERARSRSGL